MSALLWQWLIRHGVQAPFGPEGLALGLQGFFGGAVGRQVARSGQAVAFAALTPGPSPALRARGVEHHRDHPLAALALAEEAAGGLVVYRVAAHGAAHVGTGDDKTTRRLFREGKSGQRMVAVVLHTPRPQRGRGAGGEGGKRYRLPTARDLAAYRAAEEALEAKRQQLWAEWGLDPVPDEPLPPLETLGFRVQRYGFNRWGDLFNARQQLALITFADAVRRAHARMVRATGPVAPTPGADPEFAKAVTTYLALAVDKIADYSNVLCQWRNNLETVGHAFSRQALPMLWDYVEGNPVTGASGTAEGALEWVLGVLAHLTRIPPVEEGEP